MILLPQIGDLIMSARGWNLSTVGKSYEVRGNGVSGSRWHDKPLYGWVTHLPAGWIFTPAPDIPRLPDGEFYPDFDAAFPRWTGGLNGTWSDEVAKNQSRCVC
jgi:hypothetical protein